MITKRIGWHEVLLPVAGIINTVTKLKKKGTRHCHKKQVTVSMTTACTHETHTLTYWTVQLQA